MPDLFDLLSQPLQWWWAKRTGELPVCDKCDDPAVWKTDHAGYACPSCEGERTQSVTGVHELEPRDYLTN